MRRLLLVVVLVFCILLCAACSENGRQDISEKKEMEVTDEVNSAEDATTENPEENEEIWGSPERISTTNHEGKLGNFFISLPHYNTIKKGGGRVAQQTDGTLILIDTESRLDESIPQSLEEAFEFYKYKGVDCLDSYRNWDYENFDFITKTSEIVEINGYKMSKHTGTHTFTFKDAPYEMNFVAYVTQLKANDGYIFWMVIDETEEQSLSETISSHGENMAKSLVEDRY